MQWILLGNESEKSGDKVHWKFLLSLNLFFKTQGQTLTEMCSEVIFGKANSSVLSNEYLARITLAIVESIYCL